ncbi:hypothetical protein [Salipiger sp.]|uniref:hypothetical protein n=1 Tax=Salipiger sp. TaxID=2078585 RepID=UPI003A9713C6
MQASRHYLHHRTSAQKVPSQSTARPVSSLAKKGADIETLRKKIATMTDGELHLNIVEGASPTGRCFVSESTHAARLVSFRRAMKRAVQNAMRTVPSAPK